jgi:rhodanese-related sulfurtransferase
MNKKLILWILGALATCAVVALLILPAVGRTTAAGPFPASKQVSNAELRGLVAKGVRLVDVRTAAEFSAGHIAGSENVPIDALPAQSVSWDKTKPIAVYCATGARSANAYQYLVAQGFLHVYDLPQGLAAWDGALTRDTSVANAGGGAAVDTGGKPVLMEFYTDS